MLDNSAIGQGVTHQPHITLTGTKMSGLKSLPASPNQGHKRSRSLQRAVTLNTTHIAEYNRTQPLKLASNSHDRDMAVDSFSSLNLAKKQHDAHSRSDTNIYSAGNSRPTTPTSSLSRFPQPHQELSDGEWQQHWRSHQAGNGTLSTSQLNSFSLLLPPLSKNLYFLCTLVTYACILLCFTYLAMGAAAVFTHVVA